jgi:hypothetical protein
MNHTENQERLRLRLSCDEGEEGQLSINVSTIKVFLTYNASHVDILPRLSVYSVPPSVPLFTHCSSSRSSDRAVPFSRRCTYGCLD